MCACVCFKIVCVCLSLSLSLSLSLNDLSIFPVAVLFLGISLLILDKFSVFFVRRLRRTFFEQVVHALGLFVVTSESDVSPVVKRRFRLFD